MAYDPYTETRTDSWTWEAQCAIWRERAIHQAARAERFKALAEACRAAGATLAKEPR